MKVSRNVCFYVFIACMLLFVQEARSGDNVEGEETNQTTGTPSGNTVSTSNTNEEELEELEAQETYVHGSGVQGDREENDEDEQRKQKDKTPQSDSHEKHGDENADGKNKSAAGTSQSNPAVSEPVIQKIYSEEEIKEAKEFFGLLFERLPNHVYEKDFKEQREDHSSRMNMKIWNEKIYMANAAFEEGNRPVFLVVGGLSKMDPLGMEAVAWFQLAKRFRALLFFVEHRFYGHSFPEVQNLEINTLRRLLTSNQTITDIALFIEKSVNAGRQVVVFGKGYGGTIATWMRLKHPHQVQGAVVMNAPLQATVENKYYYEFFDSELKETVKTAIKDAYAELRKAIAENAYDGLQKQFNMCESLDSQSNKDANVEFMFWSITTYLAEIVKFKKADPSLFIKIMGMLGDTEITDTLEGFANAVKYILYVLEERCLAVDYKKAIDSYSSTDLKEDGKVYPKALKFGLGIRQTLWLSCSEYGQFPTSDGTNTFGESIKIDFYQKICRESFNINDLDLKSSVERTNIEFGGNDVDMRNLIFISNGDERWDEIGITESKPDEDKIAVKIEAGAEASELLSKYDVIVDNLTKWLPEKETEIEETEEEIEEEKVKEKEARRKFEKGHLTETGLEVTAGTGIDTGNEQDPADKSADGND